MNLCLNFPQVQQIKKQAIFIATVRKISPCCISPAHTYILGHCHRQSLCIEDLFSAPAHPLSLGLSHPGKFKDFH